MTSQDALSKRHRESRADCQNRVLANELASTVNLVDNTSNLVRNAELATVKQVIDSLMLAAA